MADKVQAPPSPAEIGDRISQNLKRVQGYLDILQSEISNPEKIAPGSDRLEWERLSRELSASLTDLDQIIKSSKLGSNQ